MTPDIEAYLEALDDWCADVRDYVSNDAMARPGDGGSGDPGSSPPPPPPPPVG